MSNNQIKEKALSDFEKHVASRERYQFQKKHRIAGRLFFGFFNLCVLSLGAFLLSFIVLLWSELQTGGLVFSVAFVMIFVGLFGTLGMFLFRFRGLDSLDLEKYKENLTKKIHKEPRLGPILAPALSDIKENKLSNKWYEEAFVLMNLSATPPKPPKSQADERLERAIALSQDEVLCPVQDVVAGHEKECVVFSEDMPLPTVMSGETKEKKTQDLSWRV